MSEESQPPKVTPVKTAVRNGLHPRSGFRCWSMMGRKPVAGAPDTRVDTSGVSGVKHHVSETLKQKDQV